MRYRHSLVICTALIFTTASTSFMTTSVSADDADTSKEAIEVLVGALHDSDGQIRLAAAWSLTQIGEPGITKVIEVLSSEDQVARSLAAQVLGNLRAKSAITELSRVVQDENGSQHARLSAIRAIGIIFTDPGSNSNIVLELPGTGGGF